MRGLNHTGSNESKLTKHMGTSPGCVPQKINITGAASPLRARREHYGRGLPATAAASPLRAQREQYGRGENERADERVETATGDRT